MPWKEHKPSHLISIEKKDILSKLQYYWSAQKIICVFYTTSNHLENLATILKKLLVLSKVVKQLFKLLVGNKALSKKYFLTSLFDGFAYHQMGFKLTKILKNSSNSFKIFRELINFAWKILKPNFKNYENENDLSYQGTGKNI